MTSIREFSIKLVILVLFAYIPTTQFLENETAASANNLDECKTFLIIKGLKTFNSK